MLPGSEYGMISLQNRQRHPTLSMTSKNQDKDHKKLSKLLKRSGMKNALSTTSSIAFTMELLF